MEKSCLLDSLLDATYKTSDVKHLAELCVTAFDLLKDDSLTGREYRDFCQSAVACLKVIALSEE